jgi:hypothetical protein
MKVCCLSACLVAAACAVAHAGSGDTQKLLDFYANQAKATDSAFGGFSAERGESLFRSNSTGGKPDTPSCTVCHTNPMAVSANPQRYTDQEKAEKWFGRNCRNVLGRECTAREKGDFITFMLTQ